MTIEILTFLDDPRIADKYTYARADYDVVGTMRYPSSIFSPTFEIEVPDGTDVPSSLKRDILINQFNMACIPELDERIYLVTEKVMITNNLLRVSFAIDPLATYFTEVIACKAFVRRCAGTRNQFVNDERLPFEVGKTITESIIQNDAGFVPDFIFDPNINIVDFASRHFSIVIQGGWQYLSGGLSATSNVSGNSAIAPTIGNSFVTPVSESGFAVDVRQMVFIMQHLQNNDSLAGYLKKVIAFPFDLDAIEPPANRTGVIDIQDNGATGGIEYDQCTDAEKQKVLKCAYRYGNQNMGGVDIDIDGTIYKAFIVPALKNMMSDAWKFAKFTLPSPSDFIEQGTHTLYELFLPYKGWIKLDINQVGGDTLAVYYSVNFGTGEGIVRVYDETKGIYIYEGNCTLGVELAIDKDTSEFVEAQRQVHMSNMVMSTITGALGMMAGGAMGSKKTMFKSAIGLGRTIMDAYNYPLTEFTQGQSAISSGNDGLYSYQRCMLRVSVDNVACSFADDSDYDEHFGRPLEDWRTLSTLQRSNKLTYVEASEVVLDSITATDEEKVRIKSLLASGVYI